MPNYNRTRYYIDVDAIRVLFNNEKALRGVSLAEIEEQTGVLAVGLSRFSSGKQTLSGDSLITLIKWANGDVLRFIKRRGTAHKHVDTPEMRQLRIGAAFLHSMDVTVEQGESPVDTMIRLLAKAKERGLLDDQQ